MESGSSTASAAIGESQPRGASLRLGASRLCPSPRVLPGRAPYRQGASRLCLSCLQTALLNLPLGYCLEAHALKAVAAGAAWSGGAAVRPLAPPPTAGPTSPPPDPPPDPLRR